LIRGDPRGGQNGEKAGPSTIHAKKRNELEENERRGVKHEDGHGAPT